VSATPGRTLDTPQLLSPQTPCSAVPRGVGTSGPEAEPSAHLEGREQHTHVHTHPDLTQKPDARPPGRARSAARSRAPHTTHPHTSIPSSTPESNLVSLPERRYHAAASIIVRVRVRVSILLCRRWSSLAAASHEPIAGRCVSTGSPSPLTRPSRAEATAGHMPARLASASPHCGDADILMPLRRRAPRPVLALPPVASDPLSKSAPSRQAPPPF